jgi:hypothetical protein
MENMAEEYPWYKIVTGEKLEQGDIFYNYPIFLPKVTPETIRAIQNNETPYTPVDVNLVDVIVLSQSCDLDNNNIDTVILCPIWLLADYEALQVRTNKWKNAKERAKRKEDIRQGNSPALHMLSDDDSLGVPLRVIEFKRIYTTPKDVLTLFAKTSGKRLRLLSPYREHLSQAFARYFMRVGLPQDISSFKK